jgi:saccharopine dehydrogenase-like NADP-dependent oxidoreductase
MHQVLLLGAGKIGSAIAKFLASTGDYDVLVGDVDERALARLAASRAEHLTTRRIDSSNLTELERAMDGRQSVLSALNYALNPAVARTALKCGASYFDLTEDVETAKVAHEIAQHARAGQIFMPQCGLAPGFVSIAAYHLAQQFERLEDVELRVGALPIFPTNGMKYNLTWSTDGLINEYGNPCEAVHDGEFINVLPLEGLEHFSLDGIDYEAFNTSGGVGTLAQTLAGKVRTLNYKTVRYRGHRDLMFFLMNELRLNDRREILKDILENAVPMTPQDVVLIFCTVTGWKDGRLTQITDARKIYHGQILGEPWSAIQITTAAGICAALDLHAMHGRFEKGFVRQEQVSLPDFLSNRFGRHYANGAQEVSMRNGAISSRATVDNA